MSISTAALETTRTHPSVRCRWTTSTLSLPCSRSRDHALLPKCYSREEAQTWVDRQIRRYARHGHGLWLVLDMATGQPVGQVGLLIQQVHGG